MTSSTDTDGHPPSLLLLDSFSLVHVSQFLISTRDLASLQCTCKTLHVLLQASGVWARVLKLNYGGLKVQLAPPVATSDASTGLAATEPSRLPNNKELCRILEKSAQELCPVRFIAVYTDGGVDMGTLHYWADHAFIPNSWAPFCAKFSDNVNLLAILKTGRDATGELSHRQMMISSLKWVLPLLQQNPMPSHPETYPVDSHQLDEAAEMLSSWKTQRLESFFCQMAARAAARDPLGLSMLRGVPAAMEARNAALEQRSIDPARALEERREAVRLLGQGIQMQTWYDRAYRLKFIPPSHQHDHRHQMAAAMAASARGVERSGLRPNAQAGLWHAAGGSAAVGRGSEPPLHDSPYVLDEMAVRSELMTPEAASSVAILHGLAVSREGRLSCPVQSGALIAGLLPQDWPQGALGATHAAMQLQQSDGITSVMSYHAMLRAVLEQPSVRSLNDKLDAESVFAACASDQLPPWVRHVVMEHAEYIELLPPHLSEKAAATSQTDGEAKSAATGGGGATGSEVSARSTQRISSLPELHPVLWFRFTDHTEYSRRRLSNRARTLLRHVAELCRDAAELLDGVADQMLESLRREVTDWAGPPQSTATAMRPAIRQCEAHAPEAAATCADSTTIATVRPPSDGNGESGSAAGPSVETTATAAAAAARQLMPPVLTGSPRPESLSLVLHRSIRLAERLTSLGTAATVLAPELREAAGFSLPDSDVHGLLEQANAMKAGLSYVAQQLAALEKLGRAAHVREALELGKIRSGVGGWGADKDIDEEMGTGSDDEREDSSNEEDEKVEEEEDKAEEGSNAVYDEANQAAGDSSQRSGGSQRNRLGSNLPKADEMADRACAGKLRPEGARADDEIHWLNNALVMECEGLWNALEHEVLGIEGRQARRALAAGLRRQQLAAAAAAVVQMDTPKILERRNEDLLRRLPVSVGALASPTAVAAAGGAAASLPRASSGSSGDNPSGSNTLPSQSVAPPAVAPTAVVEPMLEPPAPDGWAAERLFDPELQHDVDSGRVVLLEAHEDGHRVLHLAARLLFPVAANAVVFKAIRPENLMAMVGWDENEQPNVDMQYVALQGRVVRLPPGVQAVPGI